MNIDITELLKTGQFEFHYTRQGDSEEWSIIPVMEETSSVILFDDLEKSWEEDIPWDHISEHFDWVAMDKDGTWTCFIHKPSISDIYDEWVYGGDIFDVVDEHLMPAPPHWTQSLARRPTF